MTLHSSSASSRRRRPQDPGNQFGSAAVKAEQQPRGPTLPPPLRRPCREERGARRLGSNKALFARRRRSIEGRALRPQPLRAGAEATLPASSSNFSPAISCKARETALKGRVSRNCHDAGSFEHPTKCTQGGSSTAREETKWHVRTGPPELAARPVRARLASLTRCEQSCRRAHKSCTRISTEGCRFVSRQISALGKKVMKIEFSPKEIQKKKRPRKPRRGITVGD